MYTDSLICSPDSHRLPPLPVECYYGNSYAEKVEGVREEEEELITRLVVYLNLLADGEQRGDIVAVATGYTWSLS